MKKQSVSSVFSRVKLPVEIDSETTLELTVAKKITVGAAKRLQVLKDLLGDGTELQGETLSAVQQTFCALVLAWSFEDDLTPEILEDFSLEAFMAMLDVVMTHFGLKVENLEDAEETSDEEATDSPS